jgi:hypothetical protein
MESEIPLCTCLDSGAALMWINTHMHSFDPVLIRASAGSQCSVLSRNNPLYLGSSLVVEEGMFIIYSCSLSSSMIIDHRRQHHSQIQVIIKLVSSFSLSLSRVLFSPLASPSFDTHIRVELLSATPLSPALVISLFLISPIISQRLGQPFILTAASPLP